MQRTWNSSGLTDVRRRSRLRHKAHANVTFLKDLFHLTRERWATRAKPYAWFASVGILSLLPSAVKGHLRTMGPLHVPAHVLVFAVSAFVACRSAQSVARRVVTCAAVIAYGGALEALQSWIFRGPFEWDDVATDACGVLLAFLFAVWAGPMRNERRSTTKQCGDPATHTAALAGPVTAKLLLGPRQPASKGLAQRFSGP